MTLTATEAESPGEPAPVATTGGAPRAAPSRGGLRRALRSGRIALLAPLLLALAMAALLLGTGVTAPSWVRHRVEAAAAEALGGGTLRFEAITVRVPRDLHPEVRLLGVSLRDREGRLVARVPEASLRVSPRGLLLERRLLVQEIALAGAELSLARAADGSVAMAFGHGGEAQSMGPARGLASLPEQVERLFERPALEALRSIRVDRLVANYEDARARRSWTLDGGSLSLDLRGGTTRLAGEVSLLSGRAYVTHARLDYESPRGSPAARIALTLTDVAAADVASQSPALTWLRVVDAPISMALRVELDGRGALGPTTVALKMAAGELRPSRGAEGVAFDLARAYLAYDPGTQEVRFDRVEVRSDWGGVLASGQATLGEVEAGLPRELLGRFALREITLDPPGSFAEPQRLPEAAAQVRLRLDPFTLDVAEASLGLPRDGAGRIGVTGQVAASPEGWRVALDGRLAAATRDEVLALWPEGLRPGVRWWLGEYLTAGTLRDLAAELRLEPGGAPVLALGAGFEGLAVRPLPGHPPITGGAGRLSWDGGTFAAALDSGTVEAPEGGSVDVAGTAITIRPGDARRAPATVSLAARGPITAALSLLDQPPWRLMGSAGLPVELAEGSAEATGRIELFLGPMTQDELRYVVAATLREPRSDVLVPGWTLAADALDLVATEEGIVVSGDATLGSAQVEGAWRMGFGPEALGRSTVDALVEVTPEVLSEFGIALPEDSVAGRGTGEMTVALGGARDPAFSFRSDLRGLRLAVPELGWSKEPGRAGELLVEGSLGTPVRVDRLRLSAPGLSAEGSLRLTGAGAFDRLRLSRLRLGDWLDAPVTVRARAGSDTPAIAVEGGTLDLAKATLGGGGGGEGEGGPVTVALDRLQITEGVALTSFVGDFSTVAGLEGAFSGFVNDGPPVTGRVAPQAGRVAARIRGGDAGAVLRAANLFTRAEGGELDVLIVPEGEASYMGELWITGLRVRDAPVLASLLNAASVVGLLQQLGGQGIVFDEVSADFRIDPAMVVVGRSSAVGAGLGLSMDGVFDTEAYWMDFRGVVSPLYLLNGIGSILTRPGEGLLGFNYTLRGDPDAPEVGVNPLSVLTPGMFREIFRSLPPRP